LRHLLRPCSPRGHTHEGRVELAEEVADVHRERSVQERLTRARASLENARH